MSDDNPSVIFRKAPVVAPLESGPTTESHRYVLRKAAVAVGLTSASVLGVATDHVAVGDLPAAGVTASQQHQFASLQRGLSHLPHAAQAEDAAARLWPSDDRYLSLPQVADLTRAIGHDGQMGEAQVLRAANTVGQLSSDARATLDDVLSQAGDALHRVEVWRDLSAGHGVRDVAAFAEKIHAFSDVQLTKRLSVTGESDYPGGDDSHTLVQQWTTDCGPTDILALEAQLDPEIALGLQTHDKNLSEADPALNPRAAATEKAWLERYGGHAVPEGHSGGVGMGYGHIADLGNDELSSRSGYTYDYQSASHSPKALTQELQEVRRDAAFGVAVPIAVTDETYTGGHFAAVVGVEGTASNPALVIYDPADPGLDTLTVAELAHGDFSIAGWDRLTGFALPQPSDSSVPEAPPLVSAPPPTTTPTFDLRTNPLDSKAPEPAVAQRRPARTAL